MSKYDYVIVGSGLFGSVFANKMTSAGKKCIIIEKKDKIGGNVRTEEIEGKFSLSKNMVHRLISNS